MKTNKILTIAIPTYNRSNYLKDCLDNLCPYITDEIDIVVRDNCSDNYDFWDFIKPYQERYGIKCYRNDANVGQDGNFALIFQGCETKWLLLLGDDDIIQRNAIPVIIQTLRLHSDDVFIKFNSDFEGQVIGLNGFAKAMASPTAFLASFFMSEGFHNVEKTRNALFYNYKYLSMRFSHIIRVMMHLREFPKDSCYFSSVPILTTHGEDISWKRDELIIPYLMMFDVFRPERKVFNKNIFRTVASTLFYYIDNASLSCVEKIYFWKQIFSRYGFFNTLINCYRTIAKLVLNHLHIINK